MNYRRLAFYSLGLLLIFGTAVATTYLCLEHFVYSQRSMPAGVTAAHSWAHTIGLTKDQEAKLAPMDASLQKDIDRLQIKLAQERLALCSIMHQGAGNTQELDTYITRIGALEAEQQRLVVQHLLTMREMLTPPQRDKFFNAVMQSICQGCRTATGSTQDMCGMCKIKKG